MSNLDQKKLSSKLKINTNKVIQLWKLGKTDKEICNIMQININKLNALRYELQENRWKDTMKKRKIKANHIYL